MAISIYDIFKQKQEIEYLEDTFKTYIKTPIKKCLANQNIVFIIEHVRYLDYAKKYVSRKKKKV